MTTVARIISNLKDETYILRDGTSIYFDKLRSAFIDIKDDKQNDYLYFSFFTLSSATLEYCLNHILITFCISEFGPNEYKKFAETYINYPFKKKLSHAPYIVSKCKFLFNEDHYSFKTLSNLISTRNNLMHTKEFLNKIDAPYMNLDYWKEQENKDVEFDFFLKVLHIESITKDDCLKLGEAIGDFKKLFMEPFFSQNLNENELIKAK